MSSKEKLGKSPVDIQRKQDDWNEVHTQLRSVQRKANEEAAPEQMLDWNTSFTVGFLPGSTTLNPVKVPALNAIGAALNGVANIRIDVKGGSSKISDQSGSGAKEAAERASVVGAQLQAGGAVVIMSPTLQEINARLDVDPPVRYGEFEGKALPTDCVSISIMATGTTELRRRFVGQIQGMTGGLSEQN